MKKKLRIAVFSGVLVAGSAMQVRGQSNIVQPLNINLTAYDTASGKAVRITTKDLISDFAGTNVPNGQLWLVTPPGNPPGTSGDPGDLNAFLRVTSGNNTVVEVPSPDSFNLFQNAAQLSTSGTHFTSRAFNHFSIDFGAFHAELYGFATWAIQQKTVSGIDLSGSGSFTATVSGLGTEDGATASNVPIKGTISAGPPKPGP